MKLFKILFTAATLLICINNKAEAVIKLVEFTNESKIKFNNTFDDGRDYLQKNGISIDKEGASISDNKGRYKIIFEDADKSGYHRPHWKFHIWVEDNSKRSFLAQNKMLYAVVFYDGEGEVKVNIDSNGKIHVTGGYDVKDVLYPWAVGTIGRGNPYHTIKGTEIDENGVKYFDNNGFVAFSRNLYVD
ncbi:MAG: hypothetical protein H0W88_10930 [Parachlamydiaceae bacterium]|nr:hypothetical protein [Parachlamydiaceae bacterium]